jgi:hypothetical protein
MSRCERLFGFFESDIPLQARKSLFSLRATLQSATLIGRFPALSPSSLL